MLINKYEIINKTKEYVFINFISFIYLYIYNIYNNDSTKSNPYYSIY